jgi:DNA-binding winged helix-turn-helix (wHTH) protein
MALASGGKYLFGQFELDSAELILRRDGEIVPLTPKTLQALVLLIQNGGRVVSRKEMIEELWPDLFVEESNLTVVISMASKALGESVNGNHYIETVPKRGYRFVPEVKFVGRAPTPRARFEAMQITRLTHDGYIMEVAISPDARLLAFVLIENGKQCLWIQQLESGERWTLSAPDPALCWGLRFSHDGQSLFFITTQPNSTISELFRVSLRGGPAQKLVINIDSGIALSPDGNQIAFVRSFPGQHRDAVVVADVDGSAEHEIASRQHPDKFSFATASWSPDGRLIALGASRSTVWDAIIGVPTAGASASYAVGNGRRCSRPPEQ